MTKIQTNTINAINANFNNPLNVTRAQIQTLVDAGSFKWPYFITDKRHGFVLARGLFNVPSLPSLSDIAYVGFVPNSATPIQIPGKFANKDVALATLIELRKKAKKSYRFATVMPADPSATV